MKEKRGIIIFYSIIDSLTVGLFVSLVCEDELKFVIKGHPGILD